MLVDLEIQGTESETILRAIDHIYLVRKLEFQFKSNVEKVSKVLEKVDVYITEAGGYFITLPNELAEGYTGEVSTDLDGLEPYLKGTKKVVHASDSRFELVTLV